MNSRGNRFRSKINHHRYSHATGGCSFETFEARVLLSADPIGAAALVIPVNFEAYSIISSSLTHPQDNGDERLNREHAFIDTKRGPDSSNHDDKSGRAHAFADHDQFDNAALNAGH